MKNFIFLILFIVSSTALSYAQDVTIDNTFGDNGIVVTPNTGWIEKTVISPNEKILNIGLYRFSSGVYKAIVGQYLQGGSIDESFGDKGFIFDTNTSYEFSTPHSICIQPDNKFLIAGRLNYGYVNVGGSYVSVDSSYVSRYNENGTLDHTFGNDGIMKYDFESLSSGIYTIKQLPDGKFLISIYDDNSSTVAKINSDGTIDDSWANNGFIYFNEDEIDFTGIKLNDDESFYCYGNKFLGYNIYGEPISNPIVIKFLSDGTIDSTFGADGIVEVVINENDPGFRYFEELIVLGDSNLLFKGPKFFIKLLPDGNFDTIFGIKGIVQHNKSDRGFIVLDSGDIIVGGTKQLSYENWCFSISRFFENGEFDSTFNQIGYYDLDLSDQVESLNCLTLQDDGKLLVSGGSQLYGDKGFALVRLIVKNSVSIVNPIDLTDEINIYPNPVKNQINISSNSSRILTIKLFDNFGRIVLQKNINTDNTSIHVSFASGIYYAVVTLDSGARITKRVFIQ